MLKFGIFSNSYHLIKYSNEKYGDTLKYFNLTNPDTQMVVSECVLPSVPLNSQDIPLNPMPDF